MRTFARPIVVLSKCLEIDACRYNGQLIPDPFVKALGAHVDFVPICPEVEIGLGVPRDPIRIQARGDEPRLVQPSSGRDLTEAMVTFSERFLSSLKEVDGFILKTRSPSCGIKDVKIYPDRENVPPLGKRAGFFGIAVLQRFPGLAVEDEGRLKDFTIREHFLTHLFATASFRALKRKNSMSDLVRFHASNKYLLMTYNQKELRILGKIVANHEKRPIGDVLTSYEEHVHLALSRPARRTAHINTLMHTFGYMSDRLNAKEKALFLDTLEQYREARTPISSAQGMIRAWVARFDVSYLEEQTYFYPFPEDLITLRDSGKAV